MTMLIFRASTGGDFAIPEEEITALWPAAEPGHTLITRQSDESTVEVICDFNDLLKDGFDRIDLRPKAKPIPLEPRGRGKKT